MANDDVKRLRALRTSQRAAKKLQGVERTPTKKLAALLDRMTNSDAKRRQAAIKARAETTRRVRVTEPPPP